MRRVVITGMAPVCSLGCDHETFFRNLCDKKQVLVEVDKSGVREKIKTSRIVPFPETDDGPFAERLREVRLRGPVSAYASALAALRALEDAGMDEPDEDTGIYVGAGAPNINETTKQVLKFSSGKDVDPLGVLTAMQNSLSAWISIILGTHGRSLTMSTACASGTETVGMGYEDILCGRCDMALCGGSDYLADENFTILRGFERLKAVNTSEDGIAKPFCAENRGFLFCEGAAGIVLLEELDHARKRGARIYAELTGFEYSSDAHSIVAMDPDGVQITRMIRRLKGDRHVDYYNAHGTGTKLNDSVESAMIKDVFGDRQSQPAVTATKGLTGHALGASGTLELIASVNSIRYGKIHGNIGGTLRDDINITYDTRDMDVERVISGSYGFGGHNAAVMIESFRDER